MIAHVGGVPIEETLGSLTPTLLVVFGVASATIRAHLRALRRSRSARTEHGRRRVVSPVRRWRRARAGARTEVQI